MAPPVDGEEGVLVETSKGDVTHKDDAVWAGG